jgi:predicted nucleic acid-binding protein
VLDTSVVIDLPKLPGEQLPDAGVVSAVTVAELCAGLHSTNSPAERAARTERLLDVEEDFDPIPFDSSSARVYGRLVALTIAFGRNPRPRKLDLMIAATAAANDLPLYTRNPKDFEGLEAALTVVPV